MVENKYFDRPAIAEATMKHKALVDKRQAHRPNNSGSYLPDLERYGIKITFRGMTHRFENGEFVKNNA